MDPDLIRSAVARRLVARPAKLPKSMLGRPVRLIAGLAGAGARSLGRSLQRTVGRGRDNVGPEVAVAGTLGKLKGATMKVGQVLGYIDLGLPENWRAALSVLQTQAPPLPPAQSQARVRALLAADLGAAGQALARNLDPEPLATASVGQVQRSRLPDGTPVVVKVVHPNLAKIIAREFVPAAVASRVATWIYPRGRLYATVSAVRARVLEECDYALEARRQQRFAALFAGHATVVVPAVHAELSSPRILTTAWVEGVHLDEWLASHPSDEVRNRAGEALFDVYVGALFRHGIYNCDPHPGNYLFLPDGRVAVVDFGCAREFEAGFVERLAALTAAICDDDDERVRRALVALDIVDPRQPYDGEATRWLLRAFLGPMLRDEVAAFDLRAHFGLRELLRRWRRARGLSWSGELVFLLRTFLGVSAVLAKLGARANWYRRLRGHVDAAPSRAAEVAAAPVPVVAPGEPEPLPPPPVSPVAAAAAPAPVDGGPYEIVLVDAGTNLIALVREIREVTGMELREVKYLIDAIPQPIGQSLPRAEAESLRARLESAGARVELRRQADSPRN
jgi:predicted unusual protein kinase regulating ubiquinone biosynthesis (AarF/ABC1/UbiB family)/ribosomal protein L7/L12